MNHPTVCTWANVDDGCPITYSVDGSNAAHFMIGDNQLELGFAAESLRTLVKAASCALAEMDARFEQEEAERAARASGVHAECSA